MSNQPNAPATRRGKLAALVDSIPRPLKALAIRFDKSPIDNVESLTEFTRTRASYVAQTSLYGYLKTRMGTRYREFFEDEVFSVSIRVAAAKLFVSCHGDLSVYAAAVAGRDAPSAPEEAAALAVHCFRHGLERALAEVPPDMVPGDAIDDFAARCAETHWANAAQGAAAFAGSQKDIIRFAPVVEEFKTLDEEIVTNSIRFRWRDIREQLRKRIDSDCVLNDWRALSAGAARPEA